MTGNEKLSAPVETPASEDVGERVRTIMRAVRRIERAQTDARAVGVDASVGASAHHLSLEVFEALPSVGPVTEWRSGADPYWQKMITEKSYAYTRARPSRVDEITTTTGLTTFKTEKVGAPSAVVP